MVLMLVLTDNTGSNPSIVSIKYVALDVIWFV